MNTNVNKIISGVLFAGAMSLLPAIWTTASANAHIVHISPGCMHLHGTFRVGCKVCFKTHKNRHYNPRAAAGHRCVPNHGHGHGHKHGHGHGH